MKNYIVYTEKAWEKLKNFANILLNNNNIIVLNSSEEIYLNKKWEQK